MKIKKVFLILVIISLLASLIMALPVAADEPENKGITSTNPTEPTVRPINNPSEAVFDPLLAKPVDKSLIETVTKLTQNTRFNTTDTNKVDSPITKEQSIWGTEINWSTNIYGVYGYQAVYNNITLSEDGDQLYAPTICCTNQDSLEIVTFYRRIGTTTYREIWLFNHYQGGWVDMVTVDANFITDYVRNGNYIAELLYSSGYWYAYLYNWTTSSWSPFGDPSLPRTLQSGGWDYWEEYDMANNWPALPIIWANYLTVKIGNSGNDWRRVTSTYGQELGGGIPYDHDFYSDYYYWYVGPGDP